MIIHNRPHIELAREVVRNTPDESITALMQSIADRIAACRANPVHLSDLVSILRENSDLICAAVLRAKPPEH